MSPLVLAADGGGSKVQLAVATAGAGGSIGALHEHRHVGGDIVSLGGEGVREHLRGAVAAVCRRAAVDPRDLGAAVLGLPAHGTSPTWDRPIEEAVAAVLPGVDALVMNDVALAREAAFASGAGVLALAGTGAMAWAKAEDGREAKVGGWGFLFGDEGGGFDLGREGLRAASRAADGRGPATSLAVAAPTSLGVATMGDAVRVLAGDLTRLRRSVAALAPVVLDAAAADPVAADLVRAAARHLVEQVATARTLVGGELPVSSVGGLFAHATFVKAFLSEADAAGLPRPDPPREAPVAAALRLAARRVVE